MLFILLVAAYCVGVAVDGFLYGRQATFSRQWDRERAWLAALLWPLSMWVELGYKSREE